MSSIGETLVLVVAFAGVAIPAIGHDPLDHCGHAMVSEFFDLSDFSESKGQELPLLLADDFPVGMPIGDIFSKLAEQSRRKEVPLAVFYDRRFLTLTFTCFEEYTRDDGELVHVRLETRVQFKFSDVLNLMSISNGTDSVLASGPAPRLFDVPLINTQQAEGGNG